MKGRPECYGGVWVAGQQFGLLFEGIGRGECGCLGRKQQSGGRNTVANGGVAVGGSFGEEREVTCRFFGRKATVFKSPAV